MLRVSSVEAKGCRGIVDGPELVFGRDGVLLLGDNGSGKSSYVDALEKVLANRCGSTDAVAQTVSWAAHGRHVNASETELTVTLTDGATPTAVTLTTDRDALPASVRELLQAAERGNFVLRRSTLLRFVAATPLARYAAVESFLNMERFSAFESALRELSVASEQKRFEMLHAWELHAERVRTTLGLAPGSPVTREVLIAEANARLSRVGLVAIDHPDQAIERLQAIEILLGQLGDTSLIQSVESFGATLNTIGVAEDISGVLEGFLVAQTALEQEEVRLGAHFYDQVLREGLAWIEQDALENCPLCGNDVEVAFVRERVTVRLAEHEELVALRRRAAEAHSICTIALTALAERLEGLVDQWQSAIGTSPPAEVGTTAAALRSMLDELRERPTCGTLVGVKQNLTTFSLDSTVALCSEALAGRRSELPTPERVQALLAARQGAQLISDDLSVLENERETSDRAQSRSHDSQALVAMAESARKGAISQLLTRVSGLADSYYKRIHPNEVIGSPLLEVARRGASSLALTSEFHGRRGDPRGHFSDGHIDTLGLCLFLAIRRLHHRQEPQLALLVLDDVLHSIDASHRLRVAELLMDAFADHQLLITTHDRLWFEELKQAARACQPQRRLEARRIARWSLASGPVWGDHMSDAEWLESPEGGLASPADRAAKAGRCLEHVMQKACHGLELLVPYREDGNYTLDPLWLAFEPKARAHGTFVAVARQALDDISTTRAFRNWGGAHWNEWAQGMSMSEADRFVAGVVALRAALICTTCHRFLEHNRQIQHLWSCRCGRLQYTR